MSPRITWTQDRLPGEKHRNLKKIFSCAYKGLHKKNEDPKKQLGLRAYINIYKKEMKQKGLS